MKKFIFLFLFFFLGISQSFASGEYSLYVQKSLSQNLSKNVIVPLTWGTVVFDTDFSYNSSTYSFQPQKAGYYVCSFSVDAGTLPYSGDSAQFLLTKSGNAPNTGYSVWVGNQLNTASRTTSSVTGIFYLNGSTDYVYVRGFYTGSGTGTVLAVPGNASYTSLTCYPLQNLTSTTYQFLTGGLVNNFSPVNNISLSGSSSSSSGTSLLSYGSGAFGTGYTQVAYSESYGALYLRDDYLKTMMILFVVTFALVFTFFALTLKVVKSGFKGH